jgi:hypothetical protein
MHGDLISAASWRENWTAKTNQGSSLARVCASTEVNGALASLFSRFHYFKMWQREYQSVLIEPRSS